MDDKAAPMHHLSGLGDSLSVAAILGAFAGWLPYIATLAALIWYGTQLYDWFSHKLEARRIRNDRNPSPGGPAD